MESPTKIKIPVGTGYSYGPSINKHFLEERKVLSKTNHISSSCGMSKLDKRLIFSGDDTDAIKPVFFHSPVGHDTVKLNCSQRYKSFPFAQSRARPFIMTDQLRQKRLIMKSLQFAENNSFEDRTRP